jgi:hypothetical protein
MTASAGAKNNLWRTAAPNSGYGKPDKKEFSFN